MFLLPSRLPFLQLTFSPLSYFEDILAVCPESVEGVSVEPDGTWRSDDDKHGTAKPRTAPPSAATSTGGNTPFEDLKGKARETPADSTEGSRAGSAAITGKSGNGIGGGGHVLTLDDDSEDDEPLAKRARTGASVSTSSAGAGAAAIPPPAGGVLDLTLSSDDDDEAAPVRAPPPPVRPALAAARVGSSQGGASNHSGSDRKSVADVQADIDAMNRRMEAQYGPDWRSQFGCVSSPLLPPSLFPDVPLCAGTSE